MRFRESGLMRNKLIEDAFEHSQESTQALRGEIMDAFKKQIDALYEHGLKALDEEKTELGLTEQEYKEEKERLGKVREAQLRMGPALVTKELDNIFKNNCLAPALEVQKNSDGANAELIAAAMLINCVRSPVDYKRIVEKFGEAVSGIVADVLHIDAYSAEREKNLTAAAPDTKRAYTALLIANLDKVAQQAERLAKRNPPQKLTLPPGQEELIFKNIKPVWGNDKRLDKRVVDVFNAAAAATSSPFTIEVSEKGTPELVKGIGPKPPTKKPPGKKPTDIGDDVF